MSGANTARVVLMACLVLLAVPATRAAGLTWTGCGITKKAFMEELAKVYRQKTGVAISLSGGGATKGLRAVSAGISDMGGTCRPRLRGVDGDIHPEERNARLIHVAWDAIVPIVHPSNPVADISLADLKRVYDGVVTNWKDLGGADQRIVLVMREGKYSGVGHMFRRFVFADPEYIFRARGLAVKSTGPLEIRVEKIAAALAMDGISSARHRELKFLSIDGVAPTKENIASGKYPLFRPLYLAVNANGVSAQVQKFIDFVLSPDGQAIISRQGTVNLEEGRGLSPLWESRKKALGF